MTVPTESIRLPALNTWQPLRMFAPQCNSSQRIRRIIFLLYVVFAGLDASPRQAPGQDQAASRPLQLPPALIQLFERRCSECHQGNDPAAGLDLTQLPRTLERADIRQKWERIHDRVTAGEMPPDGRPLPPAERDSLRDVLAPQLRIADANAIDMAGRGTLRRLTREEFENNLRALLHLPHLDVRDMLPPDRIQHQCNRVADTLDFSRIQRAAYLDAAEMALREAMASSVTAPPVSTRRLQATQMFQDAATFGGARRCFTPRIPRC